jgi:uncharacterized membrane protein
VNVEQRLVNALRATDRVEPSTDLWARVVYSIEEDQAHRRRVAASCAITIAIVAGLTVLGLANLIDTPTGRQVRIPAMELIETIALVVLVAVLGPAIRRFGRGYAHDLWRITPDTATSLLRLLDVAYLLVFGGYILVTSFFDFGPSTVGVAEQIEDACRRIGGLVVTMGLLHAATIMTLPIVALVSNSTRVGRALPRWLVIALTVIAIPLGLIALWAIIGLSVAGIN